MTKKEQSMIYLDGIPIRLIPKDLDGDGKIGDIENIKSGAFDEQDVIQYTELKQVISELNEDVLSKEGMSPIDMNTTLSSIEKTAYHAFDALVVMKFLPSRSASLISRIGKRLNVSLVGGNSGEGRKQIVDIVGRNQENKKSSLDKMGMMIGKGN